MEKKQDTPQGWEMVPLGEFVENEKGKKPKKQKETSDSDFIYPYVDIEAFEKGNIRSWTNGEGCRLCSEDDFLMVWDGSRSGLVGKGMKGALGSTLVRINFPKINNDYALYFLQSKYAEINTRAKGVGIPHVDPALLWNYVFPIAPTNEQKRIVTKIEELFSELDSGIESLKTAREQLKVYRQAILKNAFEGKLTQKWREDNKDKLLTADELLNKNNLELLENKKFSQLPPEWAWIKSGGLFSFVTSGSRGWAKYYSDDGAIFIRIGNLDFDSLEVDLSKIQYVSPPKSAEGKRTQVEEGDFLISITGYLGMFAIAPKLDEAYVNQHIALARPYDFFNKEYVGLYITAKAGGHHYLNGLTKGAVKAGLRLDDIRSFPVPMCSIDEQKEVVSIIKEKLSNIDKVDEEIEAQLKKSESLRQSILKQAFSGKLVAQDPADEPASALLERIKSEKQKEAKKKKAA